MTSIKIHWLDGTFTVFNSANGIVLVPEQFWLNINDNAGQAVGLVPREQIKYVSTAQDAVAN